MKPRFILSRAKVLEQHDIVKAHADIVSFSSKTNQDVAKVLEKDSDCMFSVHFFNELKHLENKERVIFLAQAWDEEFIKKLLNLGIKNFIVDNEADLDILIKSLDRKINLYLRMKLKENTIRTEKYFVFGMKAETINNRVKELKNNENIEKLGVHFHRKTQNMSEWNLKYEISNILEEETLSLIDMLCIGGGLPSEYANTNINVLESIFKKIDELKEWLNSLNIKLIIEPGRFIAAPAVKLETEIVGVYDNTIIVNASVYNTDMDAIVVPVKLLVDGELEKGTSYAIKGITPCSMDIFRYKIYLDNPVVGDKITFLNAGAYNFSSDFCDLEKLETVIE